MEPKRYQKTVLEEIERFLRLYDIESDPARCFSRFWKERLAAGDDISSIVAPYRARKDIEAPFVCVKSADRRRQDLHRLQDAGRYFRERGDGRTQGRHVACAVPDYPRADSALPARTGTSVPTRAGRGRRSQGSGGSDRSFRGAFGTRPILRDCPYKPCRRRRELRFFLRREQGRAERFFRRIRTCADSMSRRRATSTGPIPPRSRMCSRPCARSA